MIVTIDNDTALEMLMDRVCFWTDYDEEIALYEQYYTKAIENGDFNGMEFDVQTIVDNDYINNFEFGTIDEIKEQFSDFTESNVYAQVDDLILYYAH